MEAGSELHYVLVGACRLAGRRVATVGTDHLLVSLALRSLPPRTVLYGKVAAMKRFLRRATGTDGGAARPRPPGYDPAAGALREARWRALDGRTPDLAPEWSERAHAAVSRALDGAGDIGTRADLLSALLADEDGRSATLIDEARVDASSLRTAVRAMAAEPETPRAPLADGLVEMGFSPRRLSVLRRVANANLRRMVEANLLVYLLELDAVRQAVRAGSPNVTTAHLATATISLDHELRLTGRHLPAELGPANAAGGILAANGVHFGHCLEWLSTLEPSNDPVGRQRRRPWRTRPRNPQWTVAAARAADNARLGPDADRAGSSHLLLEALAVPGPTQVRRLLTDRGVDPDLIVDNLRRRSQTKAQ